MPQMILTAVGPDRPGLVGELTTALHQASANILDTRMINLRGQFALVLLLDSPQDSALLGSAITRKAEAMGLQVRLTPQGEPASRVSGMPFDLRTYSMDQPGIVARLSSLLRSFNVNIEELSAWQESAPFAGSPLFRCEIRITVPPTVGVSSLRAELTRLCNELNCDVDLEPVS